MQEVMQHEPIPDGAGETCKHCGVSNGVMMIEYFKGEPCPSLLVSRLCAIAFDAGLNGERLLGGWDLSGGFYGFKGNVTLSAEEAE